MDAADRRSRLARARLYLVTEGCLPGRDARRVIEGALAGGVDVLQLRDKQAGDAELLRAADRFRRACDDHDALFVVNDRPDLALAAGADGVHVGQDDARVADVRAEVGDDMLIGLSTHAPEQLAAGVRAGADYLCAGPVWETPTKPGRPAAGLAYVEHAASHAGGVPWFAIGGIDTANVERVVAAGARRIVVVRAIRDADDPEAAARALRRALERTPQGTGEEARAGTAL